MSEITLLDKTFKTYLTESEVQAAIQKVADDINRDYEGQEILFIGVLNGAFMFAADLLRMITVKCRISFVKICSYSGIESTECVQETIGLKEDIKGKHVILVEDIVDTGITIERLYHEFLSKQPASLDVCTLLFKPDKYTRNIPLRYVALSVPNAFIVGYGFDYDGYGRNFRDIYQL